VSFQLLDEVWEVRVARVPEAELERLKAEVSVQRLAEARGVELRRHGADLIGLCPFHEDHEPSLVISPAKNLWHCLGACQAGGSVVDWVMRAEGVSFRHAVEGQKDRMVHRVRVHRVRCPRTAQTHEQASVKAGKGVRGVRSVR
jgi:DNA primase